MKYSSGLDGLRGISVVFVILYHYGYLRFGWIGVQMFFVLSGYLITNILLEDKKSDHYYYNFYSKRILRIFPLYFFYIMLLTILFAVVRQPDDYEGNIKWLITFTYNIKRMFFGEGVSLFFTHFWSLSVEEQFYLFWPFIVYKFSELRLKCILVLLLVGVPGLRYLLVEIASIWNNDSWWLGSLVYNSTFCQMDAFAVGAIIATIGVNNIHIRIKNIAYLTLAFLITGLTIAYCINGSSVIYSFSEKTQYLKPEYLVENGYMHVWFYSAINLLTGFMIMETLTNSRTIIDNKIMVYIGKISYGVYVYHLPLLWLVKRYVDFNTIKFNIIGSLLFVLYFVVVIGISALSYHFLEYRFLKLKKIIVKA
ncbi:MAG: acyltransferase family protein [Geobacter sp.]|nr:acyltransferase family protein [Geobacter sp.]